MNKHTDGGPAYPRSGFYPETAHVHNEDLVAVLATKTEPTAGMSLLDYFAAHALNGLIAFPAGHPDTAAEVRNTARAAYAYARAMIEARRELPAVTPLCQCEGDDQVGEVPPIPPPVVPPAWPSDDSLWDLPAPG